MIFFDRKDEIALLRRIHEESRCSARMTILTGKPARMMILTGKPVNRILPAAEKNVSGEQRPWQVYGAEGDL